MCLCVVVVVVPCCERYDSFKCTNPVTSLDMPNAESCCEGTKGRIDVGCVALCDSIFIFVGISMMTNHRRPMLSTIEFCAFVLGTTLTTHGFTVMNAII